MIANMMIPRRSEDWDDCKYDDTKEKKTGRIANMMIPRSRED